MTYMGHSYNYHAYYEKKWNETKPIRGREVDVRPIGQRRRDWEQITRKQVADGYSYCCRLYQTDCVEYMPNGDILLRTAGWVTTSTSEFIHEHSPVMCVKRNKNLWVLLNGVWLPLPSSSDEALAIRYDGMTWSPVQEVKLKVRVIDRAKAKEVRAPLQPFLTWADAFLKMSDGWVMHETMKSVLGWDKYPYGMNYGETRWTEKDLITELLQGDEREYLYQLCRLAVMSVGMVGGRAAETVTWEHKGTSLSFPITHAFTDRLLDIREIKQDLYKWVSKHRNIFKIVEVAPGTRPIAGVV